MLSLKSDRSVSGIKILLDYAVANGVTARDCLKGTGLTDSQISDALAMVSIEQEFYVIRNFVEKIGDAPGLGLKIGTNYHFTALGAIGLAIASSPSAYLAVTAALRYVDLMDSLVNLTIEEIGQQFHIILSGDYLPLDLRRFALERTMGIVLMLADHHFNIKGKQCRIYFSFPSPSSVTSYEQIIGCSPYFNADRTELVIDTNLLKNPVPNVSPLAFHAVEEQCQRLIAEQQASFRISTKIWNLLIKGGGRPIRMQEIADYLGLSKRTLHRRLEAEGLSYMDLCDGARHQVAEHLLIHSHLHIDKIANSLGYAETASFIHAFKRWTGVTPHAYRVASSLGKRC